MLRTIIRVAFGGMALFLIVAASIGAFRLARDGEWTLAGFVLVGGWILAGLIGMVARFVRPGALNELNPKPSPAPKETDGKRKAKSAESYVELDLSESPLRIGQSFRVHVRAGPWSELKEARLVLQCIETLSYLRGPSQTPVTYTEVVYEDSRSLSGEDCELGFEVPVGAAPTMTRWRPPWMEAGMSDYHTKTDNSVVWRFLASLVMKDGRDQELECDPVYVLPELSPGVRWKRPELAKGPDNPHVHIELDGAPGPDSDTWPLGGVISGRLIVERTRRRRAKDMRIELLWQSWAADGGCALVDNRVADLVVTVPPLLPAHRFEAPFSFKIDDRAPISYRGSLIEYVWLLRARTRLDWLFGTESAMREISVGPRNLLDGAGA